MHIAGLRGDEIEPETKTSLNLDLEAARRTRVCDFNETGKQLMEFNLQLSPSLTFSSIRLISPRFLVVAGAACHRAALVWFWPSLHKFRLPLGVF